MFKGIHASAKSQWLETVCSNMSVLKNMSHAMDRLGLLEDLASQINGIGKAAVWKQSFISKIVLTHYEKTFITSVSIGADIRLL